MQISFDRRKILLGSAFGTVVTFAALGIYNMTTIIDPKGENKSYFENFCKYRFIFSSSHRYSIDPNHLPCFACATIQCWIWTSLLFLDGRNITFTYQNFKNVNYYDIWWSIWFSEFEVFQLFGKLPRKWSNISHICWSEFDWFYLSSVIPSKHRPVTMNIEYDEKQTME